MSVLDEQNSSSVGYDESLAILAFQRNLGISELRIWALLFFANLIVHSMPPLILFFVSQKGGGRKYF